MNDTTSSDKRNIRFVPVTETARLIRQQLKQRFPGCKFSIRCLKYANGASISVSYGPEGPPADEVNAVCKAFQGARFDGSIDLQESVYHYLVDDDLPIPAFAFGTKYSGGRYDRIKAFKPSPDAERVRFGADFVFVSKRRAPGSVAAPATTAPVDFDDCPF